MQETFRSIIHEMGGTPMTPMPTAAQDYGIEPGGRIIHEVGCVRMGTRPEDVGAQQQLPGARLPQPVRHRRRPVRDQPGQERDVDDPGAGDAHQRIHRRSAEGGQHMNSPLKLRRTSRREVLKVLLAAPAATFAWTEAEAAAGCRIGPGCARGDGGEAVRAEVLHRHRIQARARARRHRDSKGRAIGQRHRRRRSRIHGLHDDRSAGAAGGDARRVGVARCGMPEALRQDVPRIARKRNESRCSTTSHGRRACRQALGRRLDHWHTASRSLSTSAISPRAASGRRGWASTICNTWATAPSRAGTAVHPRHFKKLGVSYE